jgi:hypothetical protein
MSQVIILVLQIQQILSNMKYTVPNITREKALTSVGSGWSGLVNEAYDYIETRQNIKVVQVKEKYGGLRIYTDAYDAEADTLLINLETRSFTICEVCGRDGKLRGGSWYLTLCEEHANGKEAIKPF